MRTIPFTKGYIARVDDEDYDVLTAHKWTAVVTGKNIKRVYAYRRINWDNTKRKWGGSIYMHRQITDAVKGLDVDHIDGDTLNNQRSNLRTATRSQNLANNRRAVGVSGFRGVTRTTRGESAPYKVMFRNKLIGTYFDIEEAARAYDAAAIKEFGEFAKLNFPIATLRAQSKHL